MPSPSLRKAARERRDAKIKRRRDIVNMAVSGFGYDIILEK